MFSNNLHLLFLLLVLAGASCKKENNPVSTNTAKHTDYYPLKEGSFHVYLIDSIYYNNFTGETEVYQYQLKEAITETFLDESNQTNYRMERYCKFKLDDTMHFDSLPWVLKNVWFVSQTRISIQRVEENMRFVNLTNPVKNGVSWDGNGYNTLANAQYTYQNLGEVFLEFPQTVKVLQLDRENLIEKQYYEQIFAKNVGLIKYYYLDIGSQNIADPDIPITERIEEGIQYTKTLIDFYIPQ